MRGRMSDSSDGDTSDWTLFLLKCFPFLVLVGCK